MSLEMAHKVILPPKKNYIPQFLKQRDINSYFLWAFPQWDFSCGGFYVLLLGTVQLFISEEYVPILVSRLRMYNTCS
jgi:hypothetical protein